VIEACVLGDYNVHARVVAIMHTYVCLALPKFWHTTSHLLLYFTVTKQQHMLCTHVYLSYHCLTVVERKLVHTGQAESVGYLK
jgi:hypothetical protein